MDLAGPKLSDLSKALMQEKMTELFDENFAKYFWDKEWHFKSEGRALFYFHDITKTVVPYCYATSTTRILDEGLSYVKDYPSNPPKRFDSYMYQVVDLTQELSQEHAGAIALPDLFVNAATFFKDLTDIKAQSYQIKNFFQSMIFVFHRKIRPSGESPFMNVTVADAPTLEAVFQVTDKKEIEKIKLLQLLFIEELTRGLNGKPFRFPVTTMNFATEGGKLIDTPWLETVLPFLATGRLNIYISDDPRKFASCCRLTNDLDLLMQMAGIDSFGNGGTRIGSHRVITLNLPAIVQDSLDSNRDKSSNFKRNAALQAINMATDTACCALKAHREVLRDCINAGLLKFFQAGWQDLDRDFFSTVGIIGLWEAAQAIMSSYDSLEDTMDAQEAILRIINEEVNQAAKEHKMPINIEQIPAESAAVKLAKETGLEILSNQYIPLWEDVDIVDRVVYAGRLDRLFTGGAITHLNIDKTISEKSCRKMIELAAKTGLTHFAFNPMYMICENGHTTVGKKTKCPECGAKPADYLTRIIGYFVPLSKWNSGRKKEFKSRKFYKKMV